MKITVKSADLKGSVRAIASKSEAHRLLILAALSDRPTDIELKESSDDIEATVRCLRALGSDISYDPDSGAFRVIPLDGSVHEAVLDCGESGSTLRFLLPVVTALGVKCRIQMRGRLSERPLSPLWEELEAHGAILVRNPDRTVSVEGKLKDAHFTMAADISSQYISGLLFAIPLIGRTGTIRLRGRVGSKGYIEMTAAAMRKFGINICPEGGILKVSGKGYVSPGRIAAGGDWSNGAFWLTAAHLTGGAVRVTGLDDNSVQGDRAVRGFIEQIAAGDAVIDAGNTPDLVPVLAVLAAVSPGTTTFINAARLRIKESDRIKSTMALLDGLGAEARETEDGLTVKGASSLKGGKVNSFNDHRIAMSAAVAAVRCGSDVVIEGAEAVRKSYPGFWEDYKRLGAVIEEEG